MVMHVYAPPPLKPILCAYAPSLKTYICVYNRSFRGHD